jgi:hypothetical protein
MGKIFPFTQRIQCGGRWQKLGGRDPFYVKSNSYDKLTVIISALSLYSDPQRVATILVPAQSESRMDYPP